MPERGIKIRKAVKHTEIECGPTLLSGIENEEDTVMQ